VDDNLLGKTGTDKVTGFAGQIIGVCVYQFGSSQVLIAPPASADGKFEKSTWLESDRITVSD